MVVQLAQTVRDFGTRDLALVARARPEHAPALVGRSEPAAGRAAKLRVLTRQRTNLPALGFFPVCCRARSLARATAAADLGWPGNGTAAPRTAAGRAPGVDRLEVIGLRPRIELIGTRLCPPTPRACSTRRFEPGYDVVDR
jgi:hypothetical protein